MKPRQVAVAIVFCQDTHRILLVTSRKNEVPKGGVEKGETSGEAAAREAHEEAGILLPPTDISPPLLRHGIDSPRPAEWTFHAVALASEDSVEADWLEQDERQRKWVSPKEALACIREWGGMLGRGGYEDGGEAAGDMARGGKKKKAMKGDAYELGLTAFARIYGWGK